MDPEAVAGLPYFFGFYEADHDPPFEQPGSALFAFNLVTVDPQGRAHWNRQSNEIPYGDLVRAGAKGLVDGDPLRPYLYLSVPQGGGGFREAWTILQTIWTITGGITGTVAAAKLTAEQTRRFLALLRGSDVVRKKSDDWTERGGGPDEIRRTIERRPWEPADMRMLLDLDTDEDAVAVLELFGSARNDDGTYALSESAEADLLRVLEREAIQLRNFGYQDLGDEDKQMVLERLRIILQTGQSPNDLPPSASGEPGVGR
jgi:hypothetical protein